MGPVYARGWSIRGSEGGGHRDPALALREWMRRRPSGRQEDLPQEGGGILILRHAHVVVQDNNGNTVLMLAARLNHLDVAKMCLLDYNAK